MNREKVEEELYYSIEYRFEREVTQDIIFRPKSGTLIQLVLLLFLHFMLQLPHTFSIVITSIELLLQNASSKIFALRTFFSIKFAFIGALVVDEWVGGNRILPSTSANEFMLLMLVDIIFLVITIQDVMDKTFTVPRSEDLTITPATDEANGEYTKYIERFKGTRFEIGIHRTASEISGRTFAVIQNKQIQYMMIVTTLALLCNMVIWVILPQFTTNASEVEIYPLATIAIIALGMFIYSLKFLGSLVKQSGE